MKKGYLAALALATLLTMCKKDDDNTTTTISTLSGKDLVFIQKAGPANEARLELGQLASSSSSTAGVQMFGQEMDTQSAQSLLDLKLAAAAYSNGTILTSLDTDHTSFKNMLSKMSGHAFDTTYIQGQIKDDQIILKLYQSEADSGSITSLKQYAMKYVPQIQTDLNKADSVWTSLTK